MYKSNWFILSFCVCLISTASVNAAAQVTTTDNSRAASEIEEMRQQFQEQRAELEKLREEIRKEADLRSKQQKLLEALAEKLDRLGSAPVADPTNCGMKTVATVQAKLVKTSDPVSAASAGTKSEAVASQQTSTANTVETGVGKVKFTGLFQGWYANGDQAFNDTFLIRRAEMRFTGEIMPKVKWSIMLDLAKALSLNTTASTIDGSPVIRSVGVNQASRVFQEAYISLSHFKRANINIGQFKIPVSQEGLQSSSALDTIERALFLTDRARGGGLGDSRDLGIMAYGPLSGQVDYQIGIFNGVGENQNFVDQNEQKTVAGRLVFRPAFVRGLQIGGSGAVTVGTGNSSLHRDRLGAELVYERGKIRIKSEFMAGVDGDVHRRGYYAHFGYRFHPKVEAIFRFDMFDPDIRRESSAATVSESDYIGGINYFIKDNNFKLQFNYIRKTFATSITPSRNLFLVNLQTAW